MSASISMKGTGRRIRYWMSVKGLKVKDLQDCLCFAWPNSIYHWIAGKTIPTTDNLFALSGLLTVPMDLLVSGRRGRPLDSRGLQIDRLLAYWDAML